MRPSLARAGPRPSPRASPRTGSTSPLIGLCSTDGLYYASGALDLPGAMFTASHNPAALQRHQAVPRRRRGRSAQDTGLAEIRDLAQRLLDGGDRPAAAGRRRRRGHRARPARRLRRLPARPRRPVRARARSRSSSTPATAWAATPCPPCSGTARAGLPAAAAGRRAAVLRARRHVPQPRGQPARAGEPASTCRRPSSSTAPTSGWPSTATPTAASSSTSDGEPVSPERHHRAGRHPRDRQEHAAGRTPTTCDRPQRHLVARRPPRSSPSTARRPVRTRVGHSFIKAEMARHRRRLRRGALGALLLPRLLVRRHRHAGGDARARRARRAGRPAVRARRRATAATSPPARSTPRSPTPARPPPPVRAVGAGPQDVTTDELDGLTVTPPGDADVVVQPAGQQHRAAAAAQRRGGRRADHGSGCATRCSRIVARRAPMTEHDLPLPRSGAPSAPQIEPWLREILRCPQCKAELVDGTGPAGPELQLHQPGRAGWPTGSTTASRSSSSTRPVRSPADTGAPAMAPFLDETLLDDEERIAARDSRRTLRALATAGAQVREAMTARRRGAASTGCAGGERPRSVLVASLGGSRRGGRRARAAGRARLAGAGAACGATCRCPDGSGRSTSSSRCRCPAGPRGRSPWRPRPPGAAASLLTVGAADSPLADVCARARGVHIDVGRGRSLVAHVALVAAHPGDAGGRRAGPARGGRAGAVRRSPTGSTLQAEACRPTLGVVRQPGQDPRHHPRRRRSRSCWATARSNGVAAAGPPRCWRARPACPRRYGELPDDASQIVATLRRPVHRRRRARGGRAGVRARHLRRPVPGRSGPAPPRAC